MPKRLTRWQRLDLVSTLWEQHEAAEFSESVYAEDYDGVDMVCLDSYVAGCVSTWLTFASLYLGKRRERVLERSLSDLDKALPLLPDDAVAYFTRMREMVVLVLQRDSADGTPVT